MHLIISMGIPAKNFSQKEEGYRFDGAVLQIIDWKRKKVVKEIKYTSPQAHLGKGLSMQFKGAAIMGDKYYVVTNTEMLIYGMDNWELENVISHPSFHDLHGVLPTDKRIYLCNTGLEIVQVLDYDGNILEEINLAFSPTYDRFDKELDYRNIATTKPHEVHINHLFRLGSDIWVTRGNLREVVNLYDQSEKIEFRDLFFPEEKILCHDGIVSNGRLFFTTVNAHVVMVDPVSFEVLDDIDINQIKNNSRQVGWVRGLEVVGSSLVVGVTRMRYSKFKEYTKWMVKDIKMSMPSSLVEIDLRTKEIIDVYEMENYQGHAVFSIIKLPQ